MFILKETFFLNIVVVSLISNNGILHIFQPIKIRTVTKLIRNNGDVKYSFL